MIPVSREDALRMFRSGATLRSAAVRFGLNEEEVAAALLEAAFNKRDNEDRARLTRDMKRELESPPILNPNADKVWCGQCERLVRAAEFMNCAKPFCKAKAAA